MEKDFPAPPYLSVSEQLSGKWRVFSQTKNMKKIIALLLFAVCSLSADAVRAQNMHLATNLLDYVNFGTINAEFGLSPTPKWSLYIKGRYNPFTFNFGKRMQNRVGSVALGAKYWFWYSNSGWFLNSNLGYSVFNTGGILDGYAYEGDACGITAGAGYALMLGKSWNLDFGFGLQGGMASYTKYACPRCGKVESSHRRFYIVPAGFMVQLSRII